MIVTLELQHGNSRLEFEFDRSQIRIGRGPSNDLIIDDVRLSRVHGQLECGGETAEFVLEGDSPTRHLRGETILASARGEEGGRWALEPGDTIAIDGDQPILVTLRSVDCTNEASFRRLEATKAVDAPLEAWLDAVSALPGPAELVRALLRAFPDDEVRAIASLHTPDDEFLNEVVAIRSGNEAEPGVHADPLRALGTTGRQLESAWRDEWFVAAATSGSGSTRVLCPVRWADTLRGVLALEWPRRIEEVDVERAASILCSFEPIGRLVFQSETHRRISRGLREENRYFREREKRHYHFKELICESASMRKVYDQLNELVDSEDPVLITGEAGTGKELMARALHHLGERREGMMITLNCGRLQDDMIDFELFGCAESQLDGAVAARQGVFELAAEGTVFLEELDKLSPLIQGKIVRMLKEHEIRRVGDAIGRTVRARFVASIHRDLNELVQSGQLRRDLYLLLKPNCLEVPRLSERRDDILPLARTFLATYSDRYDGEVRRLTDAAASALIGHDWPGNVRELQTRIEAAVLDSDTEELTEAHLGL